MAEPIPANDTAENNADIAFIYTETSAGAFRKAEAARVANSAGMDADDKGKIFVVNASGELVALAPGAEGSVTVINDGTVAYLAPQDRGDVLTLDVNEEPVWGRPVYDFVEEKTLSGATEAIFNVGFTASFDEYVFTMQSIVLSTSGNDFVCKLSSDGGSSFFTGYSTVGVKSPQGTDSKFGSSGDINIPFHKDSSTSGFFNGKVVFLTASSGVTSYNGSGFQRTGLTPQMITYGGHAGEYRMNAIKFYPNTPSQDLPVGTFSGKIRMYRVRNSQA